MSTYSVNNMVNNMIEVACHRTPEHTAETYCSRWLLPDWQAKGYSDIELAGFAVIAVLLCVAIALLSPGE
jgi:hypothetical protein